MVALLAEGAVERAMVDLNIRSLLAALFRSLWSLTLIRLAPMRGDVLERAWDALALSTLTNNRDGSAMEPLDLVLESAAQLPRWGAVLRRVSGCLSSILGHCRADWSSPRHLHQPHHRGVAAALRRPAHGQRRHGPPAPPLPGPRARRQLVPQPAPPPSPGHPCTPGRRPDLIFPEVLRRSVLPTSSDSLGGLDHEPPIGPERAISSADLETISDPDP